jgi:hypothetical protein
VVKKTVLLPGDELTIGRNHFLAHYEFDGAKIQQCVEKASKVETQSSHPAALRRREPAIS